MGSWTGRFLSYRGRLQLISSVITSMANFWMSAFRLPGSCLKEIESLCSTFLWSGPELKTSKAKFVGRMFVYRSRKVDWVLDLLRK